jgi:hypothetical protein
VANLTIPEHTVLIAKEVQKRQVHEGQHAQARVLLAPRSQSVRARRLETLEMVRYSERWQVPPVIS